MSKTITKSPLVLKKNRIIFLLIIYLPFYQIHAQPVFDVFTFQADYFPKSQYVDNSSGHVSSGLIGGSLLFPLKINTNNTILTGVDFYKTQFHYTADTTITSHLIASSFQLGLNKQVNSRWSFLAIVIPKISSDEFKIKSDDCQIGGAFIVKYKKRNSLKYELGLYYNREFFGNFFMPLIGIDWKINSRAYLYGEFPNSLTFEYKLINDKLYTGINYKSIITSFRLSNFNGGYYVREGHPFWGDNQFRIFLNYYIFNHIVFYLETGYSVCRYYQQYNNSNKEDVTIPVYSKFKDNLIMGGGVTFRFRLDEDYNDQ